MAPVAPEDSRLTETPPRPRLSLRASVFIVWVVLATAIPAVLGAVASLAIGNEALGSAGYVGFLVSLVSVLVVERPRSRSLLTYLLQLRQRLALEARPLPSTQPNAAPTKESQS